MIPPLPEDVKDNASWKDDVIERIKLTVNSENYQQINNSLTSEYGKVRQVLGKADTNSSEFKEAKLKKKKLKFELKYLRSKAWMN